MYIDWFFLVYNSIGILNYLDNTRPLSIISRMQIKLKETRRLRAMDMKPPVHTWNKRDALININEWKRPTESIYWIIVWNGALRLPTTAAKTTKRRCRKILKRWHLNSSIYISPTGWIFSVGKSRSQRRIHMHLVFALLLRIIVGIREYSQLVAWFFIKDRMIPSYSRNVTGEWWHETPKKNRSSTSDELFNHTVIICVDIF